MIAASIILTLLWYITLFCAGYGVGWLMVKFIAEFNLPIFAAIGLGALYLVFIGYLGGDVISGIENLTGV